MINKIIFSIISCLVLAALVFSVAGLAQAKNSNSNGNNTKVGLCHATGSASNPFVFINIDSHGLKGHLHHSGDIIPATSCPSSAPTPSSTPSGVGGNVTVIQLSPTPQVLGTVAPLAKTLPATGSSSNGIYYYMLFGGLGLAYLLKTYSFKMLGK